MAIDGQAFARHVRANGTVSADGLPYSVRQRLAGQTVALVVDSQAAAFSVIHQGAEVKRVPIKALVGRLLSFEAFVPTC